MDLPVNGYITWKNRHSFQWRRILPLLAAVILGTIPGTLLLRFSMPWVIKTVLGIIVVGLGVEMALRRRTTTKSGKDRTWVRLLVAFCSGVCAGLFAINMFIVAYLQRTAKDYSEFKGSLCFLFLGEEIFRIGMYVVNGMMTKEALMLAAVSAPAAAVAMLVGNLLAPRLDEKKLQSGAIVLFILGGVSIIVKSLLL